MACGATLSLKRSLEFDPVHSPSNRSPKRRRCVPMTLSPSTPPTKQHQVNPSPFSEASPKLSSEQIAAQLSAEIKRMHRRKQLHFPHSPSPPSSGGSSPNPHSPSSCHQQMMGVHSHCANVSQLELAHGHYSPMAAASTSIIDSALSPGRRGGDVPLFSLRQVSLVCERMLKEREDKMREEYDKVLSNKLAEQYEAFLKFNHDMLHRKFNETAASYVS